VTGARTRLERLFEPVAPHSLAVFRIAFGAILAWEIVRFFESGRITAYFVEPAFHFRYFGFEWVRPWPQPWLNVHFAGVGLLAALIAVGAWTRTAAALFLAGFGYVFLLEQARYLNHFYLVLLLALLLAWVPSDRVGSLAAWWRRRRGGGPPGAWVPRWSVLLVRGQLAIVYGFAALAKMNGDWLRGEPLRSWLRDRADLPWIGPWLAAPWAAWWFSYGGLLLDLLAPALLLLRRTRAVMFAFVVAFHLMNAALFDIGIFPWLSIAATTIFFEPDWPLRLARRPRPRAAAPVAAAPARGRRATVAALALWLAYQLLVPLRHFLYPGEVSWTEEGHCFSWHMKLRGKDAKATFVVTDPDTGERRIVDPRAELTDWQYGKMANRPDLILQYAHHLADRFAVVDRSGARRRPSVRAVVDCSLNGRDPQPLVDRDVDLAAQRRSLLPASWIVPLREPLRPAWERRALRFDE